MSNRRFDEDDDVDVDVELHSNDSNPPPFVAASVDSSTAQQPPLGSKSHGNEMEIDSSSSIHLSDPVRGMWIHNWRPFTGFILVLTWLPSRRPLGTANTSNDSEQGAPEPTSDDSTQKKVKTEYVPLRIFHCRFLSWLTLF